MCSDDCFRFTHGWDYKNVDICNVLQKKKRLRDYFTENFKPKNQLVKIRRDLFPSVAFVLCFTPCGIFMPYLHGTSLFGPSPRIRIFFTHTVHYVIFFFVMEKENGTKIFSCVIFSVRMVSNEPQNQNGEMNSQKDFDYLFLLP